MRNDLIWVVIENIWVIIKGMTYLMNKFLLVYSNDVTSLLQPENLLYQQSKALDVKKIVAHKEKNR